MKVTMNRRQLAALLAAGPAAQVEAQTTAGSKKGGSPFVGVQLGPHSVFDEGPDRCLDTLQQNAGVNAVFVYSHTYQGYSKGRSPKDLAPDHGITPPAPGSRRLPLCWVRWNEQYYQGTFLRHPKASAENEFYGKDVFETLAEPARRRNIQIFARILEGHGQEPLQAIAGWSRILTVDAFGRRTIKPCLHHPAYRAWWLATIEDLFKTYPLAGLKWESERNGPLSHELLSSDYNRRLPICFCEFCQAEGRKRGVSVERAREGYRKLHTFVGEMMEGKPSPPDGVYISLLRMIIRNPEILAWEQLWYDGKESLKQEIYGLVKQINPQASVGWHIQTQKDWDPIYRAMNDYRQMADYSDWIKPVVYPEVTGPRFRKNAMEALSKGVLREVPPQDILDVLYSVMGYDRKLEPSFDELTKRGFTADFVYRETKRCVDAVAGKCKVYAGVGFDVPGQAAPSDPALVYESAKRAFAAGAQGLIISREYDEMRVANLKAAGRAVSEQRS